MSEHYVFDTTTDPNAARLLWHETATGTIYRQSGDNSPVLRWSDTVLAWKDGRMTVDAIAKDEGYAELRRRSDRDIRFLTEATEKADHVHFGLVKRVGNRVRFACWDLIERVPDHVSPRARKRWRALRNADMLGCGCLPAHHGVKINAANAIVDHRVAPLIAHLFWYHIAPDDRVFFSSCQGGEPEHDVNFTYPTDGHLTMSLDPAMLAATVNRLADQAEDSRFTFSWSGTDNIVRERRRGSVIAAAIDPEPSSEFGPTWNITWSTDSLADVVFDALLYVLDCEHENPLSEFVPQTCDWCGEPVTAENVFLNI